MQAARWMEPRNTSYSVHGVPSRKVTTDTVETVTSSVPIDENLRCAQASSMYKYLVVSATERP